MNNKRDFIKTSIIILFVLVIGTITNFLLKSMILKGLVFLLLALLSALVIVGTKGKHKSTQGLTCLNEDIFNLDFKIPEDDEISEDERKLVTSVIKKVRKNLSEQIEISTNIYNKCENLYSISKQTLESTEAISSTVDSTEENIREQKNMVNKTNDLAKAMNSSMQSITDDIGKKIEDINDSFKSAENGLNSIGQIEDKLKETKEMSYKTSNRVMQLQNYSDEVGGLIDLIAGISKETKMLSLNASIEAARAGEEGKGFIVVAKEVGNLAAETEKASSKIEEVILILKDEIARISRYMGEEIAHMDSSYQEIKDISSDLGAIIENVNVGRDSLEEIHKFTRDNMNTIGEITENIGKINDFTELTTEDILKTTDHAIEQHETAKILEESLNSIKDDVFTLQQFVGGKVLEQKLVEKVENIKLDLKDENNISDGLINSIAKKYKVDSIYITDPAGYIKYTNESNSIGLNLYEIDLEIGKLRYGNLKYVASPIKKRVEDGRMFKFLTSKDDLGRLVEVGVSIESVINDIKN